MSFTGSVLLKFFLLIWWYIHEFDIVSWNVSKIWKSDKLSESWIKDLFKVQDRPIDFNVTEYKGFIDMVSDSTLLIIFKILILVIWCSISSYTHIWSPLPFPTTYLCEAEFSSHASTSTIYHSRLNAKADICDSDSH